MLDISVVSPLWLINQDCLDLTKEAVASVGDVPLILVDNASPLGGGYLRSIADTYIRNKENLGFAKAVNQGIKLAQTRYVAILSNDVRVSPNWREVADQAFSANTDAFSVHFRMTDYDVPFAYGDQIVPTGKERWCTAAFFILDTENVMCDELNPDGLYFDETFFNSYEDWDLFMRARELGYQTVYTDKACYQHMHSFTQKLVGFPKTEKNKEYFIKKHGEDPDVKFARLYPEQVAQDYMEGWKI